jgi:hypothetical protein
MDLDVSGFFFCTFAIGMKLRGILVQALLVVGLLSASLQAQNVGIGTATPDPSARLHIEDNARGLLIPNVALSATNVAAPVTGPATSLLVYNTATAGTGDTAVTPGFYYWDGTKWVRLMDMSTATPYPRLVGFLENYDTVFKYSVPSGWAPVPYTSSTNNMEITVHVNAPTEVYLVTYTYRLLSTYGTYKWSGIRIIGPTSRFITGEGSNLTTTDFGTSGSLFVTGLSPGTYTIRLEDWSTYVENRTYADARQLLVYRIR